MKKAIKVIAYVLIALLLVGGVGFIFKYTNGFNEEFKTFFVTHNDKQILTSDSNLDVYCATTQTFTVKYTFSNSKSEAKDYKVKIVPNAEKDFDFTVDGKKVKFSKVENLDTAFGLKKESTGFEITLPLKPQIALILEKVYEGKEVGLPDGVDAENPAPFRIIVSSYNDAVAYNINLHWLDPGVTGITLDTTHIIFSSSGVTKGDGESVEDAAQDTPAQG